MAAKIQPQPHLTIDKAQARRFLLIQQSLYPPRQFTGPEDILAFFERVGCVQFDPVDVVGRNPDLVLQSRVRGYRPELLDRLLYRDRLLWDGWDKVQSIYRAADWPYFERRRQANRDNHWFPQEEPVKLQPLILDLIRERGPLCSLDLEKQEKIGGFWGVPIRVERAALENLYNMGALGVHHRVGSRRYFDLVERLLPDEILAARDPHPTLEAHQDWHVLRRIRSMGLAHPGAGEHWGGMLGMKTPERRAALERLLQRGEALCLAVAEIPGQVYYIHAADLLLVQAAASPAVELPRAALIAPLDNLIWQRDLVRALFDFDYVWEVYKPAHQRQFGHYTLPVLYGERFVARCEPVFQNKTGRLVMRGWWWQPDAVVDSPLQAALAECLREFTAYLGAERMEWQSGLENDPLIDALIQLLAQPNAG